MEELFKVLIVDDEPGMRSGVSRVLNDFSINLPDIQSEIKFQVIEAENAESGLEIIESQHPDILFLDNKLPGMSGLELLNIIAEKKIDILTVMITAYASLETAVEATKNGAYDFLAKPFSPAEIKHMVRKASNRIVYKRQAKNLSEERKRVRFQFISVLAHELKSPLAAIQGYLNIISDRVMGNELSSYDNVINRSLIRLDGMKKLIFDLLDMTRIESEQRKREFAEINLCELVKKSIEANVLIANQQNITINFEVGNDVVMKGDHTEIEIILNNLISNAVKYNKNGGKVDIKITADDKKVVINVSDTGIGLKEEEISRLFKDFVRIKNEQTRNILGSGLGLSTVKKLAQLYNGDISVKSEFSKGSSFTVELLKNSLEFVKDENESSGDNILVKAD